MGDSGSQDLRVAPDRHMPVHTSKVLIEELTIPAKKYRCNEVSNLHRLGGISPSDPLRDIGPSVSCGLDTAKYRETILQFWDSH